ncbi:MAG: hypothetical protein WC121_14170 [Candidatus Kapaibacterium sp.]
MDRMNLRLTADKPVQKPKEKTLEEYRVEIEHYKSLYTRTKQDGILDLINSLELECLNLEIKQRPDNWKTYNSPMLGIKLNVNYTKEEIHGSDGTFYSFAEFLNIPSGLGDDKIKLIHQVKAFGCKKSSEYEEPVE